MNSNTEQDTRTQSRVGRFVGYAIIFIFFAYPFIDVLVYPIIPKYKPDRPIEEIVIEIEQNGVQASCSDLIGKWRVLDSSESLKFSGKNRLILNHGLFNPLGITSTSYHCDNINKLVSYSYMYYVGDERKECNETLHLGKIDGDTMINSLDYCSEGDELATRIMVKANE